jgi:hypothetical protein
MSAENGQYPHNQVQGDRVQFTELLDEYLAASVAQYLATATPCNQTAIDIINAKTEDAREALDNFFEEES